MVILEIAMSAIVLLLTVLFATPTFAAADKGSDKRAVAASKRRLPIDTSWEKIRDFDIES